MHLEEQFYQITKQLASYKSVGFFIYGDPIDRANIIAKSTNKKNFYDLCNISLHLLESLLKAKNPEHAFRNYFCSNYQTIHKDFHISDLQKESYIRDL